MTFGDREIKAIYDEVPGWPDKPERPFQMVRLILDKRPSVVVEIGVYGGQTFLPMAFALKHNEHGIIYGIDPWDARFASENTAPEESAAWWHKQPMDLIHTRFMEMRRKLGVEDHSVVIRSSSDMASGLFWWVPIDILHIDGSHRQDQALYDVETYGQMVRRGVGYIWLDDTHFDSLNGAIKEIKKFCDLDRDYGTYRLYKRRP